MALVYTGGATGGGGGGVASVTAGDTSIVVGGTAANPTVETATLDVIAADHPPAADWSNNSKKVTAVADPTNAQDAATKHYADTKVASVAAMDTSIVVGGTATAPTLATATLDVIAADHAPAADWSNNSKKITNLANGAAASDAAAFGQIPATLGLSQLIYRYTVSGSDKASIDTGVDAPQAGSNDWTGGDWLEVVVVARTDAVAARGVVLTTLNNDSGANYDIIRLTGDPSATPTAQGLAAVAGTSMAFVAHGAGGGANYASTVLFWIPAYAGTTFYKTVSSFQATPDSTTTNMLAEERDYAWRSTSAVTRLKIAGNGTDKLKVGSTLLIYKRLSA